MSKRKRYILYSAAMLLMAGCTTDLPDIRRDAALIPIGVSVGDGNVTTRAGIEVQEVQFQSGETFYVRFADNSAVDGSGNALANTLFTTTDGNGTATPAVGSDSAYFNPSMSSATLHAYYPKTVNETTATFEVAADQTSDEAYKASDLMYATTTAQKKGLKVTIPLKFERRMAKVTVLAVAVDSVKTISAIRIISGYRKVNISDPATATLGTTLSNALSHETPLKMYSHDSGESMVFTSAILPPQTVEGSFLEFDTNDGTYTYPIRETKLEGGHAYTLALRVGAVQGSEEGGSSSGSGSSGGNSHSISVMATANQTYTGNPVEPTITVRDENGTKLTLDEDYKVIFSNNIQVGRAQAIVVGIKEYAGCVTTSYFNIVQASGSFAFEKENVEITYWPSAPYNTYNGNELVIVGDGTATYSTTDTDVVSVDSETGVVTMHAPGTATITAKIKDGRNYVYAEHTASYTLTIIPRTKIEIDDEVYDWGNGGNADGTVDF